MLFAVNIFYTNLKQGDAVSENYQGPRSLLEAKQDEQQEEGFVPRRLGKTPHEFYKRRNIKLFLVFYLVFQQVLYLTFDFLWLNRNNRKSGKTNGQSQLNSIN